jgi:hypothetical protein
MILSGGSHQAGPGLASRLKSLIATTFRNDHEVYLATVIELPSITPCWQISTLCRQYPTPASVRIRGRLEFYLLMPVVERSDDHLSLDMWLVDAKKVTAETRYHMAVAWDAYRTGKGFEVLCRRQYKAS